MNSTAWHNQDICRHILATQFPPLRDSAHFKSINACVSRAVGNSVLDIGCCKAEFAKTFPQFDYTGADLEHIINHVSKVLQPNLKYITFDTDQDEYSFINNYDIIVMNSFLSEIPQSLNVLDKILCNAKAYIVLHRQDIQESVNTLVEYSTYGGLKAVNSIINRDDFVNSLNRYNWTIEFETQSFDEGEPIKKTFLLKRGTNTCL